MEKLQLWCLERHCRILLHLQVSESFIRCQESDSCCIVESGKSGKFLVTLQILRSCEFLFHTINLFSAQLVPNMTLFKVILRPISHVWLRPIFLLTIRVNPLVASSIINRISMPSCPGDHRVEQGRRAEHVSTITQLWTQIFLSQEGLPNLVQFDQAEVLQESLQLLLKRVLCLEFLLLLSHRWYAIKVFEVV